MDQTFTDNQGDNWLVFIDSYTARAARKELGYNLLATFSEERLLELVDDPAMVVDLVYLACREQCQQRGVSDRDFGRRLIGDAVDDATGALLRALADFFPTAKRQVLRKVLARAEEFQKNETRSLEEALATGEIDRAIEAGMQRPRTPPQETGGS